MDDGGSVCIHSEVLGVLSFVGFNTDGSAVSGGWVRSMNFGYRKPNPMITVRSHTTLHLSGLYYSV